MNFDMQNTLKSIAQLTAQLSSQMVKEPGSIFRRPPVNSKPWWVKIDTLNPVCTYYFGPFDTRIDAVIAQFGYIEDLEQENAQEIQVEIDQFSPNQLTICNDVDFVIV